MRTATFNSLWAVTYWAVLTIVLAAAAVATRGIVRVIVVIPAVVAAVLLLYTVWMVVVASPRLTSILKRIDEERQRSTR